MKKLTLAFLMVVGSGSIFALPTFNPMDPALLKEGFFFDCGGDIDCCQPVPEMDWCDFGNWCDKDLTEMFGLRIGYYGDFVFNRKMKLANTSYNNGARIHRAAMSTNSGLIGLSMMDRFDLFATFGASNIMLDSAGPVFSLDPNETSQVWTNSGFAWGIGGTAILWSCDCVAVGFNGQYFHTQPTLDKVVTDNDFSQTVENVPGHRKFVWHEWQVGLGAGWWIHLASTGDTGLVPYFNIKYASGRGKQYYTFTNNDAETMKLGGLKTAQGFGYALGATLVAGNRANITVEGRWCDEKAISVNGQIRF